MCSANIIKAKITEKPTLVQSVGRHNGGSKMVFYEGICKGQAELSKAWFGCGVSVG